MASAERIAHDGLRELTCGARSCLALIAGNFELPNLASLTWALTDDAEIFDKELAPRGYELFTSSSSILHHPPVRLLELDLVKGVVWERESRSIRAGCEIELLESCAVLLQLQRLKLSLLAGAGVTLERLLARAGSFRHLESIEVAVGGHENLPRTEVDTLNAELDRALPNTKLVVDWDGLVTRNLTAPSTLPAPVDSQSRNKDGRIDALGRWISGERQ